jgi:biopolymer transport protein TolQ
MFQKGQNVSEVATACEALHFTPLVPVFNSGADLLRPHVTKAQSQGMLALKSATASFPALQRQMQRSASGQLSRLEQRLPFLATTASVAPFIGLFGTVWGVMVSFTGLGSAQVLTINAVAPGLAEALAATAFGLFTAIPAVIAYNHFVHQLRILGGQLDDLQADMLAIAEKDGL